VWTFHDCSPFTGGCLYPMGCEKFESGCHHCPQLGQWPLQGGMHPRLKLRLDFTGFVQGAKRAIAQRRAFTPVVPSQWMADEAMKSGMFAERPRVIPNWVDLETFQPLPKASIREGLRLPRNAFLAFMSSGYLGDRRKGISYGLAAIRRCERPVALILVGHRDPEIMKSLEGMSVYHTNYIGDRGLLARYLAAADVSLSPTLADNLPCSIMEAMACCVPTIGFRTGGVPDLIDHNENGWLVEPEDVDGLVQGLQICCDHPETLHRWATNGRHKAVTRYHRDVFVRAHINLYREILDAQNVLGMEHPSPLARAA
jgi:glycosyltransferase involved in cell wall biosynthesis